MLHRSIIPSTKTSLSPSQVLELPGLYLDVAEKASDYHIAMVFCQHAEAALQQVKGSTKKPSKTGPDEQARRKVIANSYNRLGRLMERHRRSDVAQVFFGKSKKWGTHTLESTRQPSRPTGFVGLFRSVMNTTNNASRISPSHVNQPNAVVSADIFPTNLSPSVIKATPPVALDSRFEDTRQLGHCLGLLQATDDPKEALDTTDRNWLQLVKDEPDEHERLKSLATDVIRAFNRDEIKDSKAVTEVVYLAPVLGNDDFRYLFREFYSGIESSALLDIHQLEGLAQLIRGADATCLDADDLVQVLVLFSTRLQATHQQSLHHLYRLTLAVSYVLDAMADANVTGLDRETIHGPLLSYLNKLKESSNSYLVYQAAYAYQALLHVPDNESPWQATFRRTGRVIQGMARLVSAVTTLDINEFIIGLGNIQSGLTETSDVTRIIRRTYEGARLLINGGQEFLECLGEVFNPKRKCAWYPALRAADTMIQEGRFADLKRIVCEAPCRCDPAFQWGLCQRLGQVAGNTTWDEDTRKSAIALLGEIYRNDADTDWGQQATVKQWILDILMQLSSRQEEDNQATIAAELLLQLQTNGDADKQALYQACRNSGPGPYPLIADLPAIGSLSLLDRVQKRPVVEGNIRQLRRQRLKEQGNTVYIPPQAKATFQARDETGFSLMEKVTEFLTTEQTVFLLLGDSGAGKSTFNRQLECHLWESYKTNTGAIPLHINLPTIEKPEYDMVAKQLRRCEFTEPQIREMKLHRTFVLICDGYDESQQTHNLYTNNRLNEPGEWKAKMIISCRSEYLGVGYQDRFQPGDRNQRSESALFQEAIITPFSWGQVQEYIDQYVSKHRPLWETKDYRKALDLIPSLKELVKNPFLMSLSLEVLPRVIDLGQNLSTTRITRTALYDQFIEHWMERGKKRLGEKNLSPQAKAAFESLSDEGFVLNGVDFLKRLSKAIYKNQGGQPVVRYSRYKDEATWKSEFFSRDEEKQLLREACPLVRNGNQHRFIHRSLLEYGVALAVFDPQDSKENTTTDTSMPRRRSTSSTFSYDVQDLMEDEQTNDEQGPDYDSPLAWKCFVNEPSILQFLEERVQQQPLFKQQLLEYIEQSKVDKKWRTAASNAITILVRAGVQFNGADLQGIQIPKADLSYGVFESAQFQGADLREVNLQNAWLRRADLSNALMKGARFGEPPYLKQQSRVSMCAYSPDGKSLSVVLDDHTVKVISTSSWKVKSTLEGHSKIITSMACSPTSNILASGSRDKTARLWDVNRGVHLHVLEGHYDGITCVVYSPRGDQVLTSSKDTTLRLWNIESESSFHILCGHTGGVNCVVFSPQGDKIASSSSDKTIRLWRIDNRECTNTLQGHTGFVWTVAYSPQGYQVASASDDKTVRLWDATTGDCLHVLERHGSPTHIVAYSTRGDQVASGCRFGDTAIRLWNTSTGECLHTLDGHSAGITSIAFSPQWNLIASASLDHTVQLWDTETGATRQTLTGHSEAVKFITFSPKGDQIASCGNDMTIRLWDVGSGTSRRTSCGHSGWVRWVKYSPKGGLVATCGEDSTTRLWDVETGVCRLAFQGHTSTVISIAFSPHGDRIVTGSFDRTARLWTVETGACIHTLIGHENQVTWVAYSPDGCQVASSSEDKTVRLWDVVAGVCTHELSHDHEVRTVTYSPTGNRIASGCHDGSVHLWCRETGTSLQVLDGHYEWVYCIIYSQEGDFMVSPSIDNTVRLWNTTTGACQHIFEDYGGVYSIAISLQGSQIAYGCESGPVKLFEVENRKWNCLFTLEGHDDAVECIVFSPRGDLVITGGADKTVRLWSTTTGLCKDVIGEFEDKVNDIACIDMSGYIYLVAGCEDGFVGMWQVRAEGDQFTRKWRWRSTTGELTVTGASIRNAEGLSQINRKLLWQRGATIEVHDERSEEVDEDAEDSDEHPELTRDEDEGEDKP